MTFDEINILGNVIDTTWGKASTNDAKKAFASCKVSFLGDKQLLVMYTCMMSFGNFQERDSERRRMSTEADSAIDACLKKIKKEYNEAAEKTLKTKILQAEDDVEYLTMGQYSGRRDAFYRKKAIVEVE